MRISSEKQGLVLCIVRVLCCLNVDLQQEQYLQKKTLELQRAVKYNLKRRDSGEEKRRSDQSVRDQNDHCS